MKLSNSDMLNIIDNVDFDLTKRMTSLSEYVTEHDSEIPQKYKELILLACAAALGFQSGVRQRGIEAMHHGASEKEVIEALSLASLVSSTRVWSEGVSALADQFTPEADEKG